jgi:two-component sensor histidine kinase
MKTTNKILAILLIGFIFFIDFMTPRGAAEFYLYILVIVLFMNSSSKSLVLFSSLITILIILGYFISPEGSTIWVSIINRIISAFCVWFSVYLLLRNKKKIMKIMELQNAIKIKEEVADKSVKMLKEKEVLLKEIQHRVKNNLQLLTSILNLYSSKSTIPEVSQTLSDLKNTVHAMATVHHSLYQNGEIDRLDFSIYLDSICEDFVRSGKGTKNIVLQKNLQNVELSLSRAIPCGLIVNELFTNIFKHAFLNKDDGTISVELKQIKDKIIFSVADNGLGLPDNAISKENDSIGLEIVASLVDQIDGELEIKTENGAKFICTFSDKIVA